MSANNEQPTVLETAEGRVVLESPVHGPVIVAELHRLREENERMKKSLGDS